MVARERFAKGKDCDLSSFSVNDVAGILKVF